ncbi:MAG: serine hydrolase domain-containing protein [Anaerolineales bacterium]
MIFRKLFPQLVGLILIVVFLPACAAPQLTPTPESFTSTPAPTATPTPQPEWKPEESDFNAALEEVLDPFFSIYIEKVGITGFSVGVVKDNKIVYAKGFGVRDFETQEPVTAYSLFHMASISKPFVATAIMQLVEEGKIILDESLVTYLPYFQLDDERYNEITVRQMLSHVSGMPRAMDYHWDQPEYDEGALERYVRSLADQKLLFTPGDEFSYSNVAYEVLGDVIAKVSGQPFENYEKENILAPLGMDQSTFLKEEIPPELETTPHLDEGVVSEVYPYNRPHAPSSTLHSNVLEMSYWAIANMNRGTFNDMKILSESSYDLLWTPHVQVQTGVSMGLGWFLKRSEEGDWVYHDGGDVGFRTSFTMLPEESIALTILANDERLNPRSMADIVIGLIHDIEP